MEETVDFWTVLIGQIVLKILHILEMVFVIMLTIMKNAISMVEIVLNVWQMMVQAQTWNVFFHLSMLDEIEPHVFGTLVQMIDLGAQY